MCYCQFNHVSDSQYNLSHNCLQLSWFHQHHKPIFGLHLNDTSRTSERHINLFSISYFWHMSSPLSCQHPHRVIQSGRDFRSSFIQPSAQRRANTEHLTRWSSKAISPWPFSREVALVIMIYLAFSCRSPAQRLPLCSYPTRSQWPRSEVTPSFHKDRPMV